MTKIISSPSCGNSPKMEFLKELNIAFAKGNNDFIVNSIADDIVWTLVGDKIIEGKDNFKSELETMSAEKASELTIDKIITHGKVGATNGIMKMQNGKKYAFSDIYEFKGNKIKSITSYVIEVT